MPITRQRLGEILASAKTLEDTLDNLAELAKLDLLDSTPVSRHLLAQSCLGASANSPARQILAQQRFLFDKAKPKQEQYHRAKGKAAIARALANDPPDNDPFG